MFSKVKHKFLILLLVFALVFPSSFNVVFSESNNTVDDGGFTQESKNVLSFEYTYNAPDFNNVIINNSNFTSVTLSNLQKKGEPGKPFLPVDSHMILLPFGMNFSNISVSTVDSSQEYISFPIEPAPKNLFFGDSYIDGEERIIDDGGVIDGVGDITEGDGPTGDEGGTVEDNKDIEREDDCIDCGGMDDDVYNSDSYYPESNFELVSIQKFRGYTIGVLNLYPVRYNSAKNVVSYSNSINVEINLTSADNVSVFHSNLRGIDSDVDDVSNMVDNPGVVDSYPTREHHSYEYVVITSKEFKNYEGQYSFHDLCNLHSYEGLNSKIVTLDYIYSNYEGNDEPSKIRNFIKYAYNNWDTDYVLLGGDAHIVPVKKLDLPGYMYGPVPSDLYYACLDGGGPGSGGDDLLAEVFVGRAPVDDVDELSNFVRKNFIYLSSNFEDNSYLSKALWVGEYAFGPRRLGNCDSDVWGSDFKDEMIDGTDAHGYSTVGVPSDKFVIDTLYDRTTDSYPGWGASDISGRINSGVHFINHLGHGVPSEAMRMGPIDVMDLNNDEYFFLYSQTCSAGAFDNDDCFAEYMTAKSSGGAFAVIMNSRHGLGACSTDAPSQHYDREFWDAVFGEGKNALGVANQDSKHDNLFRVDAIGGDISSRLCYYELNLLGDPAVRLKNGYSSSGTHGNVPPEKPKLVSPLDGSVGLKNGIQRLRVKVYDYNSDKMDVTFYDASDDSVIREVRGVSSHEEVKAVWFGLDYDTTYSWYVVADDSAYQPEGRNGSDFSSVSDVFTFTTVQDPNNPSSWWNDNWSYRRPVFMSSDDDIVDGCFTAVISVDKEDEMQDDFDDLRFVNYEDESTVFDYWINNYSSNNVSLKVWVRMENLSDIDSVSRAVVWVYYGNDDAVGVSSLEWMRSDDPVMVWSHEDKSTGNHFSGMWANQVVVDSEHNIIIGGCGYAMWKSVYGGSVSGPSDYQYSGIVKLNSDGEPLFLKTVTSEAMLNDDGGGIRDIAIDSNDNIVVVGGMDMTFDDEKGNMPDWYEDPNPDGYDWGEGEVRFGYVGKIWKYSPDGELIFDNQWGTSHARRFYPYMTDPDFDPNDPDDVENWQDFDYEVRPSVGPQYYFNAVEVDPNDNIVAIGEVNKPWSGATNSYLLLYKSTGERILESEIVNESPGGLQGSLNSTRISKIEDVEVDEQGNFLVAGRSQVGPINYFGDSMGYPVVAKYKPFYGAGISVEISVFDKESQTRVDRFDLSGLSSSNFSDLQFRIVVKNVGSETLTNVSIYNSISNMFSFNGDYNLIPNQFFNDSYFGEFNEEFQIRSRLQNLLYSVVNETFDSWFFNSLYVNESKEINYTVGVNFSKLHYIQDNICSYGPEIVRSNFSSIYLYLMGASVGVIADSEKGILYDSDNVDFAVDRVSNLSDCLIEKLIEDHIGDRYDGLKRDDDSNTAAIEYIPEQESVNYSSHSSELQLIWRNEFTEFGSTKSSYKLDMPVKDIEIDKNGNIVGNFGYGVFRMDLDNGRIIKMKQENIPPFAVITQLGVGINEEGEHIYSAGESYDPDGEIVSYNWRVSGSRFEPVIEDEGKILRLEEKTTNYVSLPDDGQVSISLMVIDDKNEASYPATIESVGGTVDGPISEDGRPEGDKKPPSTRYEFPDIKIKNLDKTDSFEVGDTVDFEALIVSPVKLSNISCEWEFEIYDEGIKRIDPHYFGMKINDELDDWNPPPSIDWRMNLKRSPAGSINSNVVFLNETNGTYYYKTYCSKVFENKGYHKISVNLSSFNALDESGDILYNYPGLLNSHIFDLIDRDFPTLNNGLSNSLDVKITSKGLDAPIPILDVDYKQLVLGKPFTFRGVRSYDLDGYIRYMEWDFGDGTKGRFDKPTEHYYESEGTYTVTLTVWDNDNLKSSTSVDVTVSGWKSGWNTGGLVYHESDLVKYTPSRYISDGSHNARKGGYSGTGWVSVDAYDNYIFSNKGRFNGRFGYTQTKTRVVETDNEFNVHESFLDPAPGAHHNTCNHLATDYENGLRYIITAGFWTYGRHKPMGLYVAKYSYYDLSSINEELDTSVGERSSRDGSISSDPILDFSPSSIDFGDMLVGGSDSTSFEVWNDGSGDLSYSLSESCSWLSLDVSNGVSSGEHDTIAVSVDTGGLSAGLYSCDIFISSDGGSGVFSVSMNVIEENTEDPVLSISPVSVDLGLLPADYNEVTSFEIWNNGTGVLNYGLFVPCVFVSSNISEGNSTGEHDTIDFVVNTSGLSDGVYSCNVNIGSDGGSDVFNITFSVSSGPVLSVSPDGFDFGDVLVNSSVSSSFTVENVGSGLLEYTISSDESWCEIDTVSGNCSDEIDTINLSVNTTGLPIGSYFCNVSIGSNDGSHVFVITLNVINESDIVTINIVRPKSGVLYILDHKIFNLPILSDIALIIGRITVDVDINNPEYVSNVSFYVDDELEYSCDPVNASFVFDEKTIGSSTFRVVAYDSEKNIIVEDKISCFVYNLNFFKGGK